MNEKVFVNYRQRDAANTLLPHVLLVEAIADRLAVHFGRKAVYLDTTLPIGKPYPEVLRERLAGAKVLVVVIHSTWLSDLEDRVDRQLDWVKEEIAFALAKRIQPIPVLLHGATMPTHEELPKEIKELAKRQAVELRFGSFATGLRKIVAEIELVVAPAALPAVVPAEPPPDRSSLGRVVGLFLVWVLIGGAGAAAELVPFPDLSAVWNAILLACVPTFFLLIILGTSGLRFALRGPMNWVDERLAHTANRAFVVFGIGVFLLGLCMVGLMIVAQFGLGTDSLIMVSAIAVLAVMFMGIAWLRQQEPTPDWPRVPVDPTPYWVRRACVELETRLNSWDAQLPLAQRRDAEFALSRIRSVVEVMTAPKEAGLLKWWRRRSPWVTLPHAGLAAAAVVLATLAIVLDWVANGPDVVSGLWWLGALVVIIGAHVGSVAFEYGCERSQIKSIAKTIDVRLALLTERLALLSEPVLIAPHHLRPD